MKLDRKLADKIMVRFAKFASRWEALDEKRRQDAQKMTIMVEMVGGRNEASALLDVSDNTIDNHRKGIGDIKHAVLRDLTEHVGFPPSSLYFRWHVEGDELLFEDERGTDYRELAELDGRRILFQDDVPPFPYVPGSDEVVRPTGLAEEAGYPHLAVPRDYLGRLETDPRNLQAMVAKDDGMVPEVEEGALLLVDVSDRDLADGGLYVVNLAGAQIIRRIRRLPRGAVELVGADAGRCPAQKIAKGELARLEILGRIRSYSRTA